MPIKSVLAPILDTVLDAVVVMDRDGVIRAWNQYAQATFGWSASEAIGQNLGDLIVPPSLREAHQRGLRRFNSEGIAKVLDKRLELSGLRRDGSEVPVELSITLVSRDGRDMFVGFLRDISERKRAERQLEFQVRESRLMLELSDLASRDKSFEEALVAILDGICELADWPVGHAFLVGEDQRTLKEGSWSSKAKKTAPALVKATAAIHFEPGVGLPGRVLESGKPLWISSVNADDNFMRAGLGFESAFGFPVHSGGRCIAVLEFFSRDSRQPEEHLLLSARAIGAQVGRVHERIRSEELRALLLAELNHRAKNILAVVRGMAHLSFGSASDVAEAQKAFDRRLDSIAKANDILHAQSGSSALLSDIIREALAGCGVGEDRASLSGPDLCIDSSTSIMVSLAVHELSTNAFKYGALSVRGGSIAIAWRANPENDARFDFEWTEAGGPPVEAPKRKGFGMRILERGIQLETGGRPQVSYDPSGFRYRLTGARHSGVPGDRAKAA
ncbi:MAG TPA: PAS domain S-box protein [Sphingomicrobium sp.]|nr:PAS domain S-box protein [Sphingomicrobium sp.]